MDWRNRLHVTGFATRSTSSCHLATIIDEETGAGNAATGIGTETATGTEAVVGIETEAGEIGIGTHAAEAAPEVPGEVRAIDVQVCTLPFRFSSKRSLGTERDRRDHRFDDRRDSDRRERDDRRRDDRRDEHDRHREDPRDRNIPKDHEEEPSSGPKEESGEYGAPTTPQPLTFHEVPPVPEPRIQSEDLENGQEEGESMDAVNQDDEAMMATMGIAGFGSTKVWVFSA